METTKLILLVDHRTLGSKGVVFEVPTANVSAWIDSGKAKRYSKEGSKKSEGEESKKGKKKK